MEGLGVIVSTPSGTGGETDGSPLGLVMEGVKDGDGHFEAAMDDARSLDLSAGERDHGGLWTALQLPSALLLKPQGPLSWQCSLFPFQREGVEALLSRPGVLLADDMGLGKTLQAIAAIRVMAHQGRLDRCLVVVPASLLIQWRKALRFHAPELRLSTVEGPATDRAWQWGAEAHVFLVSYETLRQDLTEATASPPRRWHWDVVVLDEAQKIKNRDADVSIRCKRLPRKKAWALTGTPLENRVDELASILEFTRPLERDGDIVHVYPSRQMQEIHQKLQLRRKKSEVLKELPPKLISTVALQLRGEQRRAYERAERQGVMELRGRGSAIRIENILELILRLKQICNFCPTTDESAKMEDLRDRLATLSAEGHKALVYTQFVDERFGAQRIVRQFKEFRPLLFTGGLDAYEKDRVVERFKTDPGRTVMVLSLRAGGMGLNLQEASYVIHFDRWWNPAVESQAEDRTHRMGQQETVHVYGYTCEDTIEDRIGQILRDKRILFDDVVDDVSLNLKTRLTEKELYALFGLSTLR